MSPTLKLVFAAVLMTGPALPARSQVVSPVIADGAKVDKVGTGYGFTEGCTADKDGNVFFTDQNKDPGGQILRWSAQGNTISVWMEPSGRSNGQRFAPNGDLNTCADEHCQLWRITPEKKVTVLVKDYHGKLLDCPEECLYPEIECEKLGSEVRMRSACYGQRKVQLVLVGGARSDDLFCLVH